MALTTAVRKGGPDALAAWETLLVAIGNPVVDESGSAIEINGHAGTGYAVMPAQLRLIGVLGATPGGLTIAELGDLLQGIPGLEAVPIGDLLFEALRADGSTGSDPQVATFATAYRLLSLESSDLPDPANASEEHLSWAQIALVLCGLANEAVIRGADLAAASSAALTPPDAQPKSDEGGLSLVSYVEPSVPRPAAAAPGACGIENERVQIYKDLTFKVFGFFAGSKLDALFEAAEVAAVEAGVQLPATLARTQKILKAIGFAQTIAGFLAILAKAGALDARFELASPPLVRTKDQAAGEVKDLRVSMRVNFGIYQEIVTCINVVLAPSGIQVPQVETGPAAGVGIDLFSEDPSILLIGDGVADGTPDTSRTTDAAGNATFKVSGTPQRQKIPASAAPEQTIVRLRAVAALERNSLKDLLELPSDAFSGPIGGALQKVLSRARLLTFYGTVSVIDWSLYAVFDATLTANQRDHVASATNAIVDPPCSGGLQTFSGDQELNLRSQTVRVDAVLLENPQGNWGDQVVIFVPHDQTRGPSGTPGSDIWSAPNLFDLPTAISVDRQWHQPGLDPLPPVLDRPYPCTGGGGPGSGSALPSSDCGAKSFEHDFGIVVPSPRRLIPLPQIWLDEGLYSSCIQMDDLPGQFLYEHQDAKFVGGDFPGVEEVFDPAIGKIEILGTIVYHHVEAGGMIDQQLEWSLTLCRVVDEQPAC